MSNKEQDIQLCFCGNDKFIEVNTIPVTLSHGMRLSKAHQRLRYEEAANYEYYCSYCGAIAPEFWSVWGQSPQAVVEKTDTP
jgi:hypothetical protein